MKDKIFAKKAFIVLLIICCVVALSIVAFKILVTVPSDANYVADDFSYVVIDGEKYYGTLAHQLNNTDVSTARREYTGGSLYIESEVGKPVVFPYRYSYRKATIANGISTVEISTDTNEVYLYCKENDMDALRDFLKNEPIFSRYAALNLSDRRAVTQNDYIALSDELTEYVSSIEPLMQDLNIDGSGVTSRSHESIDVYILDDTYTFAKHVASILTVDNTIYLLPEYGDHMVLVFLSGKISDDKPCNATLDDIEKYKLPDELTDEIAEMMAK